MSLNFFFAEVVKVTGSEKDHDFAGDVQIRVEVDQDDKKRLKDEDLRWARNIWPVTAAQHRGVGVSGGGAIPGTRVFGFYADNDRQIPYILGNVATAGKYGSLTVGDVKDGFRGLPGMGDAKEKSLFGDAGGFYPLEETAKNLVEGGKDAGKQKPKVKPKEKSPQKDAESAPQAKNPSLTGLKPPNSVSDMVSTVKSFNPGNIGGLPSTLGAFQNLRGKLEGAAKDLIGATPFAQMQVLSSVINMNPANVLGSLGSVMSGLNNLTQALGDPAKALSMIQGGFFNSIPMSPLQNLGVNMAIGALKSSTSGNVDLNTVSSAMEQLSNGASLAVNEVANVAKSLSQFANLGPNTGIAVNQLMVASSVIQQIERLSQNIDLANPVSSLLDNVASGAISEIEALASQAGQILGVGNQLLSLAQNPAALLDRLKGLVEGNLANSMGNMAPATPPAGSKNRIPDDPAQPEYPHNQVTKTTGGHTTKVDNTPGKEQLFVSHKANTFFRVDPDGSVVIHGVKDLHEQVKGTRTLTVEGFSDITVKGSKIVIRGGSLIEIMGKCDVKVAGDMNLVVSENFKLTAKNISLVAQDQLYTNTKNTKNVVGQKHQTNANVIEENAKNTIREISEGLVYTEGAESITLKSAAIKMEKK
jgi:hypothetical protein